MKKNYRSIISLFLLLLLCLLLLHPSPALAGSCSLFEDDFSAGSAANWILDDDWSLQNGYLEVTTSSTESWSEAIYLDDFNPGQAFSLDVDFSAVNITDNDESCGLYVYETASYFDSNNSYLVEGTKTDGMAVIIHPLDQTMEFQYWDVVNWTWKTTKAVTIPWPLTSFGLSFTENAVIFRANGKNTSLKISGTFDLNHPPLDSISLKAKGHGAKFTFNHLCAVPYDGGGSGGNDIPPVSDDYPNAAPTMSLTAVDYGGSTLANPADIPVPVAAGPLLIQPTLTVATIDRGQTAYLFAYIYLPQISTGFNFSAPQPVTLGDEANFSAVFPRMIDMTGQDGFVFDVYYGYALNDGSIHYNAYEVTLGSGGGGNNDLKKQRTVSLGTDVAGSLGTSILKVLSNAGETGISGSGGSGIEFLHDDENIPNPTLLMVTNSAGNPILLKLSDDLSDDFTATTTALALVLYDPNILLLPHEDFNRVRTAVQADSRLSTLTADILALIKAKDPNPLDYDSHPELYQQAVAIARDAVQGIATSGAYAAYGSFQEDKKIKAVEVVDDKNHSTPDVVLTNRTMCYYEIKAVKNGNPFKTYKIERRNLIDYHFLKWPLEFSPGIDFAVTSNIAIGDGDLSFAFEKQKELTVVYCMLSTLTTAIGVGSTKLKNIEEGLDAVTSSGGEIATLMHAMIAKKPSNQDEANKMAYDLIYGVFHSGYTLVTTVYETQIKEQLKNAWLKSAFKILGSKFLLWGTASYAAGDIAATLWDLHYSPDTYSEEGCQVSGEYPVRLKITKVTPDNGKPGDMITVDFENSIPDAILPVTLMFGKKEVGKIYDGSQQQMMFTVPEGAETATLKLTYGIAESNGVVFSIGGLGSGYISGESNKVHVEGYYPWNDDVHMTISANWKIENATTGVTVSSSDDLIPLDGYGNIDVTTFIFQVDPGDFRQRPQGNFTITLEHTPIEGVQAPYAYFQSGFDVTFGKLSFYSMNTGQLCSKLRPVEESGITFNVTIEGNVISGDYYFPGSDEGVFVPVLLNVPYTCSGKDASGNDETWTGVWKTEIDLKFRNYDPDENINNVKCSSD